MNRRDFLINAGLASTSCVVFPSILKAENRGLQKLRVAIIGVGGRGRVHVRNLKSEHIVAFCDVDDRRAAKTFSEHPDVPRFKDFRVMLERMGSQIDAVSIAVPDHMHFPMATWVLAHGKHVLVEKPLVRTVKEAMLVKQAAREAGVVTQMGNQGHAYDGLRVIQEWIAANLIGDVKEVFHWTNRPVWPQGMSRWPTAEPTPSFIDWNLWLGVAPEVPFSSKIAPFNWRGYWNYGAGAIGDIACHAMDASYTSLNLGFPTRVWSDAVGTSEVAFPTSSTIYFEFPENETHGPIQVTWMDGNRRPKDIPFIPNDFIQGDAERNRKGRDNGTVIVGSKGSIFADIYARQPRLFPIEYHKELKQSNALPPASLERVGNNHFKEWVRCCKDGKQPGGSIANYAADFTATVLLGTVSLRVNGDPLEFVSNKMQFNQASANKLLASQYPYREAFLVKPYTY